MNESYTRVHTHTSGEYHSHCSDVILAFCIFHNKCFITLLCPSAVWFYSTTESRRGNAALTVQVETSDPTHRLVFVTCRPIRVAHIHQKVRLKDVSVLLLNERLFVCRTDTSAGNRRPGRHIKHI